MEATAAETLSTEHFDTTHSAAIAAHHFFCVLGAQVLIVPRAQNQGLAA